MLAEQFGQPNCSAVCQSGYEGDSMEKNQATRYDIGKVYSVNVDELSPNPEQPRKYFDEDEIKALAADIKVNGLLQHIVFTKNKGKLFIISGERRVRAHKLLGKEMIEAKYVEGDLLTLALMENILRSDLTAIEFSESIATLKEQKSFSNDGIAELIGKKKSTISEILKVAALPENIRNDARTKPYMTRELLLKIARKKDEPVQQELYNKLRDRFDKKQVAASGHPSQKKSNSQKIKDKFVHAQVCTINSLTDRLINSYEKMLGNMQWPVPEEDRHVLKASLENMQAAIQMILEQMDPAFANDSTQSPSETLQQQADESW